METKIVFFNSEPININEGIKIKTKTVDDNRPKTIVIAIGFKNCACKLFSNSKGVSPPIVVKEVSNTALSLSWEPCITDSKTEPPLLILSYILSGLSFYDMTLKTDLVDCLLQGYQLLGVVAADKGPTLGETAR